MFTGFRKRYMAALMPVFLVVFALSGVASIPKAAAPSGSDGQPLTLSEQVRHELAMLPYTGVFDNLGFIMEDTGTVVLKGYVIREMSKKEAETVVSRIHHISKVVNEIEVLPLSSFDDGIRVRAYRAIFSKPGFEKYALQYPSPLRIIVRNGNITLEGFVGTELDKTMAVTAARSVPYAFSVTDNLKIG